MKASGEGGLTPAQASALLLTASFPQAMASLPSAGGEASVYSLLSPLIVLAVIGLLLRPMSRLKRREEKRSAALRLAAGLFFGFEGAVCAIQAVEVTRLTLLPGLSPTVFLLLAGGLALVAFFGQPSAAGRCGRFTAALSFALIALLLLLMLPEGRLSRLTGEASPGMPVLSTAGAILASLSGVAAVVFLSTSPGESCGRIVRDAGVYLPALSAASLILVAVLGREGAAASELPFRTAAAQITFFAPFERTGWLTGALLLAGLFGGLLLTGSAAGEMLRDLVPGGRTAGMALYAVAFALLSAALWLLSPSPMLLNLIRGGGALFLLAAELISSERLARRGSRQKDRESLA